LLFLVVLFVCHRRIQPSQFVGFREPHPNHSPAATRITGWNLVLK
jgi:hypothetical protein